MSLVELRDRLSDIIAENDRRGWSERNDLPVYVQIERSKPNRSVENHYVPIQYALGSMCRMLDQDGEKTIDVFHLTAKESEKIIPSRARAKKRAKLVSLARRALLRFETSDVVNASADDAEIKAAYECGYVHTPTNCGAVFQWCLTMKGTDAKHQLEGALS